MRHYLLHTNARAHTHLRCEPAPSQWISLGRIKPSSYNHKVWLVALDHRFNHHVKGSLQEMIRVRASGCTCMRVLGIFTTGIHNKTWATSCRSQAMPNLWQWPGLTPSLIAEAFFLHHSNMLVHPQPLFCSAPKPRPLRTGKPSL